VARLALAAAASALVTAYGTLSVVGALALTRPARLPTDCDAAGPARNAERVTFLSRSDGITLDGWLLAPRRETPRRPAVIMVHGLGTDRRHELGGRLLEVGEHLAGRGHPVLLFDLRGAGCSGGARHTLGAKEAGDVGGAIDFLAGRGLTQQGVALIGYSMGAAASLLLAPSEPRVRAVVADSAYAELGSILDAQLPRVSGLHPVFTPGLVLAAWPLLGVNAYRVRPVDGMARLAERGAALLVIHGEADRWVPAAHGRRLAATYGPQAETYFVPGAGHAGSYWADPAAYLARVAGFLARFKARGSRFKAGGRGPKVTVRRAD
jgi:pimeloyl-ACP methyl ester carboxylesterase